VAGGRLTRRLLLALVLVAHVLALDWIGERLAPPSVLTAMAPPMYTRLLKPEAPPVVVAAPPSPAVQARPRPLARAVPPRPAASQPTAPPVEPPAPEAAAAVPPPAPAGSPAQEAAAAPPPPAPEPTAHAAATPADGAASAPAAPAPDSWPGDTRLSYRLGGRFRSGDLYGDARVLWQREGERYQVRVDIDVTLFATLVMTSQGLVTPEGLVPRAYEEQTQRRRRSALLGESMLTLEKSQVPRPPGVQDTASQFVELSHRFATGQEKLEVGRSISLWMARPGGLDHWTYDIVEREVLQTPRLGAIEAFRLKPRPQDNPRGKITAEMWFAPSLQYLPVRIRVNMGSEAHVDLLVDEIEQR
jgi:hypothetical protein